MCMSNASKGLWFSLEIKAEEYVAFISTEALLVHFQAAGTDKHQLRRAYRKHQEAIDAVAKERFHNDAPRPVKLDVSDFRDRGFFSGSSPQGEAIAAP